MFRVLHNLFAWSLFLLALTHSCQQWAMGNMTGSQEVGRQRMLVWCTGIAGALQC